MEVIASFFLDLVKDAKEKEETKTDDSSNSSEVENPDESVPETNSENTIDSTAETTVDEEKQLPENSDKKPESIEKIVSDKKTDVKVASTTSTDDVVKNCNSDSEDNLIEIEDPDDYLMYLEATLKKIHTRFYQFYEENKTVSNLLILGFS